MTATAINRVHARQILDSRGRPTVEAEITLASGVVARASAPSGASTGKAEAVELRDGGEAWEGRAVGGAVANVRGEIGRLLDGLDVLDQSALDARLVEADGTANFARLGGNAVLAVSLAAARAAAFAQRRPLYRRFAELAGTEPTMPLPMVNILSGGLHAGRGMDVQDFLAIPIGASSYGEALEWICRVRTRATEICAARGLPTLLADEGGLSPGFEMSEEALDLMVEAFEKAGFHPGEQMAITLDIASSSLVGGDGAYRFQRQGRTFSAAEMIEMQAGWVARYPIVSIEDGLGEDDWANWPEMTKRLEGIQLVGDDLFATQPARIRRAINGGIANSALIKVNQNGTVSGTLAAIRAARAGGYATVISARSGETEDDFLADLAVGVAGGQIKIGSVRNSERQAKYNQLLRIEEADLAWAGTSGLAPLSAPAPELADFLYDAGLAARAEQGVWTPLTGGVSSDIWHVALGSGDYCVKRALAQLRVAAEWRVPTNRNAFEWDYMQVADGIAPGRVPQPIAHDKARGLFAMAWLAPDRHRLWKSELLAGHIDPAAAEAVGDLIGRIHAATARDPSIPRRFATDANFHALRIEPYLLATAAKHSALAEKLRAIAGTTARTRHVLVHGDVSPKNILLGSDGPVLLDAECAWFGDPAFDLAFCLNHLVIKARFVADARAALEQSFDRLAAAYLARVDWEPVSALEARAAALLPALALARVDGKSPLEYLDEAQRTALRSAAAKAVTQLCDTLAAAKASLLR